MDYERSRDSAVALLIGAVLGLGAWLQLAGLLFAEHRDALLCLAVSVVAGLAVHTRGLPALRELCLRAQLSGKDLYRKGLPDYDRPIPEALGVAPAAGYLAAVFALSAYVAWSGAGGGEALREAALQALFGAALGFVDDVLELRWRDKLILPLLFALPMAISYAGERAAPLPSFAAPLFAPAVSPLFFLYILCLPVFCLNAINIYAGISGLESGQSLVTGLTLMLESLICVKEGRNAAENLRAVLVLAPFCAVSVPMLLGSRVARKTFVGDTYVSFAGCVIACAAFIGHFPLKALLFLLPQLFNFVLSLPQLVGVVHCPRHRLPEALPGGTLRTTFPRNLNAVNFALWLTGPISEEKLGTILVCTQIVTNVAAIVLCRSWPLPALVRVETVPWIGTSLKP